MIISVNTFTYVRSDQYGFQACIYQLLLKESWFDFFFLFFFSGYTHDDLYHSHFEGKRGGFAVHVAHLLTPGCLHYFLLGLHLLEANKKKKVFYQRL